MEHSMRGIEAHYSGKEGAASEVNPGRPGLSLSPTILDLHKALSSLDKLQMVMVQVTIRKAPEALPSARWQI